MVKFGVCFFLQPVAKTDDTSDFLNCKFWISQNNCQCSQNNFLFFLNAGENDRKKMKWFLYNERSRSAQCTPSVRSTMLLLSVTKGKDQRIEGASGHWGGDFWRFPPGRTGTIPWRVNTFTSCDYAQLGAKARHSLEPTVGSFHTSEGGEGG